MVEASYRSFIVGGAGGLGLSITKESLSRGVEPVVLGRPAPGRDAAFAVNGQPVRFEPVRITDDLDTARCIDLFKVQPSLRFQEVFYLPGAFLQGRFCDHADKEVRQLFDISVFGLMNLVRHFHPMKKRPYRLITITSTSSLRIRNDEAAYGAAKAAEAQFARNFHQELVADLPDAKSLIVHPGGMRTGFLPPGIDPSELMDPNEVAKLIWDEMSAQDRGEHPPLHELHILRGKGGVPRLERGPKAPN